MRLKKFYFAIRAVLIVPVSVPAKQERGQPGFALNNAVIAYVAHWFPKPSETFVWDEVESLREAGATLPVFSLYGSLTRDLSPAMRAPRNVERLGRTALPALLSAQAFWRAQRRPVVRELFRLLPRVGWPGLESAGENLWSFFAGFHLARRFDPLGVQHIHAAWANGPATAAWVASRLTGIPFSFSAHAVDLHPPDPLLPAKLADCAFVRSENRFNVDLLAAHAPTGTNKIHVVHSGRQLPPRRNAEAPMQPPHRILALGRFVEKKGFDILLRACRLLLDGGVDIRLSLGGAGPCERALRTLRDRLGLRDRVDLPGFVPYDRVPAFLLAGDVFVMPSVVDRRGDCDGIPNVIVEALWHRLPVVASAVGGIGELIDDGRTGRLVRAGDPVALADAVRATLSQRRAALEMAENGQRRIEESFIATATTRALAALFAQHRKRPT